LFVGALDEDRSPNVDALTWFVQYALPLIQFAMDEPIRLIVAGRSGAQRVRALAGPHVVLLGKVADLDGVYDAARVFIAPHRYAAGLPGKVLEAAAHGVPCVASKLLATQLGWHHGVELLSAATAPDYARSVIQLYSDETLWTNIRNGALNAMKRTHSEKAFRNALATALEHAWNCPPTRDGLQ